MNITTVGIDLAKNVFQVHGADAQGKAVLRKQLRRTQVLPFFANLGPCRVAMEACASAHHWARQLRAQGHEVKLIPPQYVKPYVKRNKNDVADAEAICEAARRPRMPTVPIKTVGQQAILSVHRARQGFVKARTAQANQIRGLLGEFGFTIPQGIQCVTPRAEAIVADVNNGLPESFRQLIRRLAEHWRGLDRQVQELDHEILLWHRQNEASRKLDRIPGIGPITASALSACIGNGQNFKNGRQFAAWLGLVPRQHSSGGKPTLLGISKRGDTYLRTLLIHGVRAVVRVRTDSAHPDTWLQRMLQRRHKNVVAVALANKNARIAWALLAHQSEYDSAYRHAA